MCWNFNWKYHTTYSAHLSKSAQNQPIIWDIIEKSPPHMSIVHLMKGSVHGSEKTQLLPLEPRTSGFFPLHLCWIPSKAIVPHGICYSHCRIGVGNSKTPITDAITNPIIAMGFVNHLEQKLDDLINHGHKKELFYVLKKVPDQTDIEISCHCSASGVLQWPVYSLKLSMFLQAALQIHGKV